VKGDSFNKLEQLRKIRGRKEYTLYSWECSYCGRVFTMNEFLGRGNQK